MATATITANRGTVNAPAGADISSLSVSTETFATGHHIPFRETPPASRIVTLAARNGGGGGVLEHLLEAVEILPGVQATTLISASDFLSEDDMLDHDADLDFGLIQTSGGTFVVTVLPVELDLRSLGLGYLADTFEALGFTRYGGPLTRAALCEFLSARLRAGRSGGYARS